VALSKAANRKLKPRFATVCVCFAAPFFVLHLSFPFLFAVLQKVARKPSDLTEPEWQYLEQNITDKDVKRVALVFCFLFLIVLWCILCLIRSFLSFQKFSKTQTLISKAMSTNTPHPRALLLLLRPLPFDAVRRVMHNPLEYARFAPDCWRYFLKQFLLAFQKKPSEMGRYCFRWLAFLLARLLILVFALFLAQVQGCSL
jgi:hypothetical protein